LCLLLLLSLRPHPPAPTLFPYTTLFRSGLASSRTAADIAIVVGVAVFELHRVVALRVHGRDRKDDRLGPQVHPRERIGRVAVRRDRKSTRLNSSHQIISYAVFCLKKKTT